MNAQRVSIPINQGDQCHRLLTTPELQIGHGSAFKQAA
jgi:hypothetical protein